MRLPVPLAALAVLSLVNVPCALAQNAAPPAAAPPSPAQRWHTNAENVRRVVPGAGHVAFATSGGVRVWDRKADTWRLFTMNDGLPTNNVFDVAFDPDSPHTLWALCGDWVKLDTDPMPRLHLAALDLSTGAVNRRGGPSAIAPKTPRSYIYFLDYRLAVNEDVAAVSAGNRVVLAFDRGAGQWLDRAPASAPLARGSHLPGMSASVAEVIASPKYAAVRLSKGIYLYDRQTGTWSPRPLPEKEPFLIRPGTFRFAGESGSVTFEADWFQTRPMERAGGPVSYVMNVKRGRFRVNPVTTGIVLEQETPRRAAPDGPVSRNSPIPRPAPPSRPQVTFCTDLVGDGKYLWVAGYNQPYRPRNGGIARLDMETGEWHHPPSPPGGLAANVGSLTRFRSGTIAHVSSTYSLYDRAKRAFADVTDWNSFRDDFMTASAGRMYRSLPDPRLGPEERAIPITLLGALDEHTSLAYGPEEPFRFVVDGQPNREGPKPSVTFLYDHRTQELTPITNRVPEMKGFRPQLIRKFGETVFLAGETRRPAPSALPGRPQPLPIPEPPLVTVWQWDPKTGAARMAERVTWGDAQRERDGRERRFRELIERRRRGSREPLVREPTPDMNLVDAAGSLWLMWERRLYRYDPRADAWVGEGMADGVQPEAAPTAALWALVHAGGGRPGVARCWSAATGWQKAQVDEVTASMLATVAPDADTLWFGGVGVVAVPRGSVRFTPEGTAP